MMDITYRHHAQMRLILRLTPSGPVVLMPAHLEADSVVVQQFVADALAQLPERETVTESMTVEQVQTLVRHWQERLGVTVSRVQVRKIVNSHTSLSASRCCGMSTTGPDGVKRSTSQFCAWWR